MGCLWAAYLWQRSAEGAKGNVTLLLRNNEELARYDKVGGVTLTKDTQTNHYAIPALNLQQSAVPITHLLIATKAQDVEDALASVRHLLTATTRVVLLQNGLKVQKELAATYNAGTIYCASTSQGAYLQQPFHVVHAGHGDTWLGQLRSHRHPSLLLALPVTDLQIQWDNDIESRLWEKLAINCAINALTVIHDCRNGGLLSIPSARQDLLALTLEIETLYRSLNEAPTLPNLQERVFAVLHGTALNISSTLQDARLSRPTEITHLNGYLCELARQHQLPYPRNETLLERFELSIRAREPD